MATDKTSSTRDGMQIDILLGREKQWADLVPRNDRSLLQTDEVSSWLKIDVRQVFLLPPRVFLSSVTTT